MKNFARRLSNRLKSAVAWHLQELRRRALRSELSSTFQRLETRRVLSVDASFAPGTGLLSILIDNQPGNNTAVLREDPGNANQFFVDENNNGLLGAGEAFGLKTALQQIEVSSTNGGTFVWQGNFSTSPTDRIVIQNVNDVRLNAQATIGQNNNVNSSITALNSVEFQNDLRFERDLTINVGAAAGSITNVANASLTVVGQADFEAASIDLGRSANDAILFGTLHFRSTGNVLIQEDSSMSVVDIGIETNTANSLSLSALGRLEIAVAADIDVQGQATFVATGANSDILVNGSVTTVDGGITFRADDSILFGASAGVEASGNNSLVLVEANFDNANGDSDDLILMNDGASIAATTGRVSMTALGADGGSITLSSVNAGANSADAMNIAANGSILDGTGAVVETENLITNGTLTLTSLSGGIGAAGVGDIDINAASLVFNASSLTNGVVFITDLNGGVVVTGVSTAQRGGALAAFSPLTISADITVGASFTFTAGNDNLANDDHLTINNNAVVTLNSLVSQTLRFEAGDDIVFDTGRVETTLGALNEVVLAADLDVDVAGGEIRQSLAAVGTIEVTTDNLQANAANGIDLDTEVFSVNAFNSIDGNITLDEQTAVQLASVVNTSGSILITAVGLINAVSVTVSTDDDAFDVSLRSTAGSIAVNSVLAGPTAGDVTIRAFDNITDGDAGVDDLDVRGQDVTLTADNGSVGSLVSNIFTAVPNPIEVSAAGVYTAEAVNGMVALDFADVGGVNLSTNTAWIQSSGDINVAALPAAILNLTNLALVADVDNNGIGNLNLGNAISVPGDLRLQGADITSTAPLGVIDATARRMMVVSDASESLVVNAFSSANPLLDAPQLQLDATSGGTLTVQGNFNTLPALKPLLLVDLDGDGIAVQTVGLINQDVHIRAAGDLVVNNAIVSLGFTTLIAGDDIQVNANVSSVRDAYARAENISIDGAINDGVIMASGTRIATNNANILIEVQNEGHLRLGLINAGTGQVGLVSQGSILDNNNSRLLLADANAGQNQIQLTNVAGLQVGDTISIFDNDSRAEFFTVAAVAGNTLTLSGNLTSSFQTLQGAYAGTLNVLATNLSMIADSNLSGTGSVGGTDLANPSISQNRFAIDTRIAFLASTSADGLHVLEYDGLSVASIAGNASFVQRVNFDGTVTPTALAGVVGLANVLVNGPIKLQSIANNISVDAAITATGDGDILLQTLALDGDIIVNANVQSDLGNISFIAGDDLRLNADVFVLGVAANEGSIYLLSENGSPAELAPNGIVMAATSAITTVGTNVSLITRNDGDILLGLISTGGVTGDVSISSEGSILDNNDAVPNATNVFAQFLTMIADSDAGLGETGSIGQADLLSLDPAANANAIDTGVTRIAAQSTSGIYVFETDDIFVDTVAAIGINIVNFNSTVSPVLTSALSDLTSGGPIKLVTIDGSIVVNDGNGNGLGVFSSAAGDILLEARNAALTPPSNITTTTGIQSNGGFISVIADNDVLIGDDVRTNGVGSIFIDAQNGSVAITDSVDADTFGIQNGAGDLLVRALIDISVSAQINSQSDIGLVAGRDIEQNATIETSAGDIFISALRDYSMTSTSIASANTNLVALIGGDLELAFVSATNVGLSAGGSISDANLDNNVAATNLSMRAGAFIGAPAPGFPAGDNPFAIDTSVTNMAAFATNGIYVQEANDVAITGVATIAVNVNEVERANFRSDRSLIPVVSGSTAALSDLTSGGPIKLVTNDGSILVLDGLDADELGVESTGAEDILLEARFVAPGAPSDITSLTAIQSNGGHISVIANDNVSLGDDVRTLGTGSILVVGQNGSVTIGDTADADLVGIQSVNGDILLRASVDMSINALVTSQQDIGIVAGRDVLQSAAIESTAGDVLVRAGRDYTMSADATTTATTNAVVSVGRDFALGFFTALNVGFDVTGNITDANILPIDGLNVSATNLSMRSGGSIGAASPLTPEGSNPNAIDTSVATISATAVVGIYVQESNDVSIDSVAAIASNSIDVEQVNFRSNPRTAVVEASLGVGSLADLSSNGPIKLITLDGSILVQDGDADGVGVISLGAGDVLLESRFLAPGPRSSITTTTGIQSNGGHISLIADNNVVLGDDVTTNSSGSIFVEAQNGFISVADSADADADGIRSVSGDILLRAFSDISIDASVVSQSDIGLIAGRDVLQSASIATTTGDVLIRADRNYTMTGTATTVASTRAIAVVGGELSLAFVSATNVGLQAGGNILDANAGINVTAVNLSMRSGGTIGAPAPGFPEGVNPFAIDTSVTTIAAQSLNGIYVEETDDVAIDRVEAIDVQIAVERANFRSDRTSVGNTESIGVLADLTSGGPIKLVTLDGSIQVNEGGDGNELGVTSTNANDILLEARFVAPGIRSGITTTTGVESSGGHISLIADGNIALGDDVRTVGSGTVLVNSQNGSISVADSIDADLEGIQSANGDVLLRALVDIDISGRISSQSDIGLVAGRDVLQSNTIASASGDIAIRAGRDYVMTAAATTTANTNLVAVVVRDIALGFASAINVGLQAGVNISDANILPADGLNVAATNLTMRSGGFIGASAPASPEEVNPFAIDIAVTNLAATAVAGVYLQESDGITIDTVAAISSNSIDVEQVNFRSNPRTFVVEPTLSVGALSDLTSNGPLKLVTTDGSIIINDGDANGVGVRSTGAGDLLLEARFVAPGAPSSITTTTGIESNGGNIRIVANGDVTLGDDVQTNALGTILVSATTGSISVVDGPDADDNGIVNATGDILLTAFNDISINARITSQADIGVVAGRDVLQSSIVASFAGDVLVRAGRDYLMTNVASISASSDVVVTAGGQIALAFISATNVGLQAGGSITDANTLPADALNIAASNLSMRAGGMIGGPAPASPPANNPFAIDTSVVTLAAQSGTGIYILESNDIAIDAVAAIATDAIQVQQVNFRSNPTTLVVQPGLGVGELSDLVSGGAIKLVTVDGSLVINDGSNADGLGVFSNGEGDILLEARFIAPGPRSNVTTTAGIQSNGGHISVIADNQVTLGDDLRTSGGGTIFVNAQNGSIAITDGIDADTDGIQNGTGDILLRAFLDITVNATISSQRDIGLVAGRDVLQSSAITTTGGDILVLAGRDYTMSSIASSAANTNLVVRSSGNVALGLLSASNVGVEATGNITDANILPLDGLNVQATNASLRAGGSIGAPGPVPDSIDNSDAIDTSVTFLAAAASSGIYIQESNDITVTGVGLIATNSIDVEQVNFRSNPRTAVVEASLSTAALADLTSNGPIALVTNDGSISINDGGDGDELGVTTTTASNVLLVARFVPDGARSNITTTSIVESNGGLVRLIADNNILLGNDVRTVGSGDIIFFANGSIDESATGVRVVAQQLTIFAGRSAHLSESSVDVLVAQVGRNEQLVQAWQTTNAVASQEGNDFLNKLSETTVNSDIAGGSTRVSDTIAGLSVGGRTLQEHFEFQNRFEADGYALFLKNDKQLSVQSILAGTSANPNVYVETVGPNDLNLDGSLVSLSNSATHGGVVLVAGGRLNHNAGQIETVAQVGGGDNIHRMFINGTPDLLDTTFFDAAQPAGGANRSTEFVVVATATDFDVINMHKLQRVAIRFGVTDELGFIAFVGYADGLMEMFSTTSNVGSSALPATPDPVRPSSPDALLAGLFVRSVVFVDQFLQSNALLPTDAVLRRADNLFLFQGIKNADYGDPASTFEDLTYDSKPILNVKSIGGGGIPMPTNPVAPPVPSPSLFIEAKLIPNVDVIQIAPVELGIAVEKNATVQVFLITYEDKNNDGQPDREELPSTDEIIRLIGGDGKNKTTVTAKTDDGASVEINIPKEATPKLTSGAPSPAEVERIKQAILADPTKPTGAYTIIFQDVRGNRSVLDVFPVRDLPEQVPITDEPAIVPLRDGELKPESQPDPKPQAPVNDKGASLLPHDAFDADRELVALNANDNLATPRAASMAFLLSSMMVLKERRRQRNLQSFAEDGEVNPTLETNSPVGFSKSDRRRRRLHRALRNAE
jgi:hypothetical protein